MARRANRHMVVVAPEADLVTRLDTELVPQLLRDDDLTFGADPVSHTDKYNLTPWVSLPPSASAYGVSCDRHLSTLAADDYVELADLDIVLG